MDIRTTTRKNRKIRKFLIREGFLLLGVVIVGIFLGTFLRIDYSSYQHRPSEFWKIFSVIVGVYLGLRFMVWGIKIWAIKTLKKKK